MEDAKEVRERIRDVAHDISKPHQAAKRKSRNREKDVVHPPGVEPGPIAWKAIILPLDQECLMEENRNVSYI